MGTKSDSETFLWLNLKLIGKEVFELYSFNFFGYNTNRIMYLQL